MIIRRIVFVWFAIATACAVAAFYTYSEFDNKWLAVVLTMAVAIIVLPILFLLTLFYHRFFKGKRGGEYELTSPDDQRR